MLKSYFVHPTKYLIKAVYLFFSMSAWIVAIYAFPVFRFYCTFGLVCFQTMVKSLKYDLISTGLKILLFIP